jgi:hypothetical protein
MPQTLTKNAIKAEAFSVSREQVDDGSGGFRTAIIGYLDYVIETNEGEVIRRRKNFELVGTDKTKAQNFLQLLIGKVKTEEGIP